MNGTSQIPHHEKLEQLKKILPEAFTEGKIDWEKLKATLGEDINFRNERYVLNWAGKSEAFKAIQTPTSKTLKAAKEESVQFDETENIFIEGENLEVLKILQKSYFGKVKMIYIDPPYNTGNDSFIYSDNFAETKEEYLKRVGDKDKQGYATKEGKFSKNSKENGQYHSNWLNMMYPRLFLAKNLLKEDGAIFISIDDNELHNLKMIMNEIFGEENFRNIFAVRRYDKNLNRQFMDQGLKTFNTGFEYILCYSKSEEFSFNPVFKESSAERKAKGYWKGFWNDADRPTMRYDILGFTPKTGQWKWKKETALQAVKNYDDYLKHHSHSKSLEEHWTETGKKLKFIRRNSTGKGKNKGVENWIAPAEGKLRNTNWTDLFASKHEPEARGLFDFPKNIDLLSLLIKSGSNSEDTILDFFAGSGSTAHAVYASNMEENLKRKWISVQLPEKVDKVNPAYDLGCETIADVAKERLKRAIQNFHQKSSTSAEKRDLGFKVFKLIDSNFKQWRESSPESPEELENQMELFISPLTEDPTFKDLVYELLLKNGNDLNSQIEEKGDFFTLGNDLILLFRKALPKTTDEITKIKPKKVIALDAAFEGNDQLKTNTALQLKDAGIEFKSI